MTRRILIGVDCGTEGVRALAVDAAGGEIGAARVAHTTRYPLPGWAEQDPREWWNGLVGAVRGLTGNGVDLRAVAAIGVTATSSTVVAADKRGEPLSPALLWMDVRATDEAARIEAIRYPALHVCPGGVSAEWGPAKALWLRGHRPDVYRCAHTIFEGGDWLILRLTGCRATNVPAAVTAWFYDAAERSWPADLYAESGCPDLIEKLPEGVLAPGEVAGTLTAEAAAALGLPAGIPVVVGGIDSVAAMIGVGVTAPGAVALITGSSNVLLALTEESVHASGVWGPYADAVVPGRQLVVALHTAGAALAWLTRDLLGAPGWANDEHSLAAVAAVPPGAGGLIALPDFQGNRTPYTEARARGAIWGLSLSHRPAHLIRAMLEGIAYASRQGLDALVAGGVRADTLRASGGAARNPLPMQLYADVLGRPIQTTAQADASALGAAMAAAVGCGLYPNLPAASAAMTRLGATYAPDNERTVIYDRLFDLFKRTYPALLPLMRELSMAIEGHGFSGRSVAKGVG